MSLVITEPIKTVNGLLTKALAAISQLLYGVQREDAVVTATADDGNGFAQFSMSAADFTQFTTGDTVYCFSLGAGSIVLYDTLGTMTGSVGTAIITDIPFVGVANPGYVNNISTRNGYRINLDILDDVGVLLFRNIFKYVPNQAGFVSIDVGALLSFFMSAPATFTFSKEYKLSMQEIWNEQLTDTFTFTSVSDAAPNIIFLGMSPNPAFGVLEIGASFTTDDVLYPNYYTVIATDTNQATVVATFNGTTAGTILGTRPAQETAVLQAVLAQKQLLSVGGANMWENLLRVGGSDINLNWPSEVPAQLAAGGSPWTTVSKTQLFGSIPGVGGSLSYLGSPTKGLIAIGTSYIINVDLRYNVTNYVATGSIVFQISSLKDGVEVELLGSPLIATPLANTGYLDVNISTVVAATTLDADQIGFRIAKSGGNFQTDLDFINTFDGLVEIQAEYPIAKLLTQFKTPKMWRGWNRTCVALMDAEYQNRTGFSITRFRTQSYDVNKSPLGSVTETTSEAFVPSTLIRPINFTELTNAFFVGCTFIGSSSGLVSETLFYELQNECPQPIMLDWINSKGGVDQWLFEISQEVVANVGEGILAERPIDGDIEFISRTKQRFPGASAQRITCRAEHLTGDQLRALHEIKQTNSLRVYLSKDGTNFIDAVTVQTFSTAYNTKNRNHKFTVTIEFPDDFDFFEGKLY